MDAEKYILTDLDFAKADLEKQGYKVKVTLCSMPKIKVDSKLVMFVRQKGDEVELIVSDFLIGV